MMVLRVELITSQIIDYFVL